MLFEDRKDAGRRLAGMLSDLPGLANAVVLGLTRGGVPVAFEIARAHRLPLDILVVRKLGAPGQPELAVGAVASGGVTALNSDLIHIFQLSEESVRAAVARETSEIARRERAYRGGEPALSLEGRTAILVDDGLATGATMRAAARAVRPRATQVVIAIPVAAASTCRDLDCEADRILCLATPGDFQAVGQFYRDFSATSDDEVRALLKASRTQMYAHPAA